MNKTKLSAVIITFNEEKNIERCLLSLLPVVDEIVVLDSFSTDKTSALVHKYDKVNFFEREWKGYADSKNYANSLATGDLILSIDADEELSAELQQNIQKLKEQGFKSQIYNINRITNYCGQWIKHCGWYPEYKPRIFRKDIAQWTGIVHEVLEFNQSTSIQNIGGHILHYSYPTIESHLRKIITYAELTARKKFEAGKRYNFFFHGLVKPTFTFMKQYFFQRGFMDGYYGFVICTFTSFFYFLRYVNFRMISRNSIK
jgi:glycosyltransferase involved in cell wall biosynthesis